MTQRNTHLWLRAEFKPSERRTPLTPSDAAILVKSGIKVSVEKSDMRIYPNDTYEEAGCVMVSPATWPDAPDNAFILGIKELPPEPFPIKHNHIYFAHVFKGQKEASQILDRFARGSGKLFDLEYLSDAKGKRVTSFGFWSGIAGASISLLIWCRKMQGQTAPYIIPHHYPDAKVLYSFLHESFQIIGSKPSSLVIGHKGRCGQGVQSLLRRFQIDPVLWGREKTADPTCFSEVLNHDILFNCIFVDKKIPPFLTLAMLKNNNKLSIVNDISCDPTGPHNPLPIYDSITTFDIPTRRVGKDAAAVDLIAIDHLPTFFPKESSDDFSAQLLPYLCQWTQGIQKGSVWRHAEKIFDEALPRRLGGKNNRLAPKLFNLIKTIEKSNNDSSMVTSRKQIV